MSQKTGITAGTKIKESPTHLVEGSLSLEQLQSLFQPLGNHIYKFRG
jgi:hypothetical protein